jgi:hypothetical protein
MPARLLHKVLRHFVTIIAVCDQACKMLTSKGGSLQPCQFIEKRTPSAAKLAFAAAAPSKDAHFQLRSNVAAAIAQKAKPAGAIRFS